jgi:membrane-bound metal-dependent hydrolase YbcI (DUF457 family)
LRGILPPVPFTFAHPAAAVPLLRPLARYGVLSALVVGSMTPDFSYFLPFPISRSQSHSIAGLFWFCVPVGLVAYVAFHRLLARPLIDLLPEPLRMRLLPVIDAHVDAPWSAVIVSLFVGAATHIAWDAFTHAGAPLVRISRALRFHLVTLSGYPLSVYTVLQHLSTALGFVLIALWLWRWVRSAEATGDAARGALPPGWRAAAILAIAAVVVVLWSESNGLRPIQEHSLRGVQFFLRRAVPTGISSASAALLLYAVVWQIVVWSRSISRLPRPTGGAR